jgi:DNA-binding MarR family transcriptional regulator
MALKRIEKGILDYLYFERRYCTTREIADEIGSSWQTVQKYADKLSEKRFLKRKRFPLKSDRRKSRVKYKFNYEFYRKLKNKI